MWTELLRPLAPALVGSLTLDKALASRGGDRLTVCLHAARLLTDQEYAGILDALRAGLPGLTVKLRIAYPALKEAVLANVASVSGFVTGLLARELPGALPYLRSGDALWRLTDGRLRVPVADELGESYLVKQGADERLAGLMKALFGVQVRVVFEVTGDMERRMAAIRERRAEEEARMAADQELLAAQAAAKEKPAAKQPFGKPIEGDGLAISELTEHSGRVILKGEVVSFDSRDLKNGATKLVTFALTDYTGTVACKLFLGGKRGQENPAEAQKQFEQLTGVVKLGAWVKARGDYAYDEFQREMTLRVVDLVKAGAPPARTDHAPSKRVELHAHTQMSAMDACVSPTDLIARAAAWGHKAIAITDHGVVQAFPEAFGAARKKGIKLIPGCEGYLIDDRAVIVKQADQRPVAAASFVVLDVETTGLSPRTDTIIEFGAVRYEDGREVAEFSQLINPGRAIPARVVEITGITDAMVQGMPPLSDVIRDFHQFCEGAVVCAHNADFDWAFVSKAFAEHGLDVGHPVLDTLALSRNLLKGQKSHKLGAVCKTLGVSLKNAHRAVHDARATAEALMIMLKRVDGLTRLNDLNSAFDGGVGSSHHVILLAATQEGMANLYRLVSEAHLKNFHRNPRIPRALIERHREGLIVGSACESGELFRAVLQGRSAADLKKIASFYDYLEIQPIGNNEFLLREGAVENAAALRAINKRIVQLGEELNIPVCATGDVHFLEPRDHVFRAILMNAKGFEDADFQPPLYLRTTGEMLEEFAYLGDETARRVVIEAPNAIAERVGELTVFLPHPEGKETFQPYWDYAEDDIRRLTEEKARAVYGDPVPDIVRARIDKELKSIIGYGFSTLYDIAVKLVAKSLSDGYIVGSRGSVGSSFVAWTTGITEVNALPPHYVCPVCRHSEFDVPEGYACGLDLPAKNCPSCGANMNRDGFNIPFEVFLGFKGDKVPDIDLNFSGEYQARAHAYVKELFGADNVFRAGTIGTIAEKTAYGYVLKYLEERGKTATGAEKERLAKGLTGVKRTTGQHPAGMVVLPMDYSIYQFTPIQRPADDQESSIITTHFDFSSMHDVLVKLDVLGHDDPTMLRKLQDLTGIAPQQVPLDDPAVFERILSLFTSPEALGVTAEQLGVATGTLGVPEFGTRFVRQMLMDTRPSTMEELIRISGLSHGTDVWLGNAQDIIRSGTATLRQCVCTRDDIMNQLMVWGVEDKMAFAIMEAVRKGKGLKPEMEKAMRAAGTPDWFIGCCKKIKYMFPKAHAVAYVMMALRIAYFKVFYPVEYYACYLRRNLGDFDALTMVTSLPVIRERLSDLNGLEKEEKAKKEGAISMLETLVELGERGIVVLPVSLYDSHPEDFLVLPERRILPPLTSLPGLGLAAAEALAGARADGPFISREDMVRRKVPRSVVDLMAQAGALSGMPETSQVSLFDL
ncbi:MAG: PolC-type DNA polymerase III [Eubacteriales bacterium]|nr:PolC-type DNA polymerase III [Christensenellaceae bacterium]MEA5064586.1 PolC-type DNA polymerase III [Eubacteriales bacterium]